jgi:succinate-semialdehyde dehydrogenase/glutarate-semialdehyde dehydrogenase
MSDPRYLAPALHIAGRWLTSGGAGEAAVLNPSTGGTLARLPLAGAAELDAALEAAVAGQALWRRTAPAERAALIGRAVALIRERCEAIAVVMTLEQGKPLPESRLEVQRAAELIEWAAQEGRRAYGQTIPAPAGMRYLTFQEPIGVVAALTPWNFPAVSPARKIGSALAAGCACIVKPSEQTPGTATALVQAFLDAGLPKGVLGLVFGDPGKVSSHLIDSPVVRMVTFTGSVPVGKQLAAQAALRMKPCLMELGGHSPTIVFDDCDVDKVARACATTKYRNAGQVCTSPTRFFVQRGIYDRFVDAFAGAARGMTVGDGMAESTRMGPLASARRVDAIAAFAEDAVAKGAKAAAGGKRVASGKGFYFEPTVLADVPQEARVMNEEPFGPIAACRPFDAVDDVLKEANRLPYGLAAYAFTSSLRNAREVAHGLECGIVGINSFSGSNPETPFGGVKDSGYGREGGVDGIRAYMTTKFVVEASL